MSHAMAETFVQQGFQNKTALFVPLPLLTDLPLSQLNFTFIRTAFSNNNIRVLGYKKFNRFN